MTHPTDALRLVPETRIEDLTRPIVGMNMRSAHEVFDIMADRFRGLMKSAAPASPLPEGGGQCSGITGELKSPDLDALEKLEESLATLDSEERDWPLVKIHGRMFHVETAAKAASDGLTALIAELKEGRAAVEELLYAHTDKSIAMGQSFLARNGKG